MDISKFKLCGRLTSLRHSNECITFIIPSNMVLIFVSDNKVNNRYEIIYDLYYDYTTIDINKNNIMNIVRSFSPHRKNYNYQQFNDKINIYDDDDCGWASIFTTEKNVWHYYGVLSFCIHIPDNFLKNNQMLIDNDNILTDTNNG